MGRIELKSCSLRIPQSRAWLAQEATYGGKVSAAQGELAGVDISAGHGNGIVPQSPAGWVDRPAPSQGIQQRAHIAYECLEERMSY